MLILRQNSKKIIYLQVNLLTFFAKIFFTGIYFDKPELTLALDQSAEIFTEFFLDPLQTPYIRQNPAYFAPHISSKYEETDPHS